MFGPTTEVIVAWEKLSDKGLRNLLYVTKILLHF